MKATAGASTFSLSLLWLLCAITPLASIASYGLRADTLAAGLLYLAGSVLLPLAQRRDPGHFKLRRFGQLKAAFASALGLLAMLQVLAFFLPGPDIFLVVIGAATAFFAIWALSPSGDFMARVTDRILLVGGALLSLFLLGETVCRLPPVVAHTGGIQLDKRQWEQENYDFLWEQNTFQARSFHIESSKEAGTHRIVVLGDSFSWGQGIPRAEDTWPYVLERLYRQRGLEVEVINLARRGYTTVNEVEALERIGWRLEPDLVILQFSPNDPLPSEPNFRAQTGEWLVATRSLSPLRHHHLVGSSYFYAYLDSRFRRLQERLFYPEGLLPLYSEDSDGWLAMQAALRSLAEQTRERRVRSLVVLFPFFHDLAPGRYLYEAVHSQVAGAVRSVGLPVIDLWPHYARLDPNGRSWWALPWDSHPGREAHALAAEVIAAQLDEDQLSEPF